MISLGSHALGLIAMSSLPSASGAMQVLPSDLFAVPPPRTRDLLQSE